MTGSPAIPSSTYRIQLTPAFGFDDVAALAPYLARLGVSHVYLSPYLQARKGSLHGYDVVDHGAVNLELGGQPAFERMCQTLEQHGLKQVVDIVPNHMATGNGDNGWWWDVLENGLSSLYADYFDVDWSHPDSQTQNRVVVPILGDRYGRVLKSGDLHIRVKGGYPLIEVYDQRLPLCPESVAWLLDQVGAVTGRHDVDYLSRALLRIEPARTRAARRQRERDLSVLKRLLARMLDEAPDVAGALDQVAERTSGDPDALDQLLCLQNYRLVYWRTARYDLDYRRFFDIDHLVALRMHDADVFQATHVRIKQLLADGVVAGLRVDHPDGLWDPEGYFTRLRELSPDAWIVVEKILARGEELPTSWPVQGTTGYDFLNVVQGLFVSAEHTQRMSDIYTRFIEEPPVDYPTLVHSKKAFVLHDMLSTDVSRVVEVFAQVCVRHRSFRDYARTELKNALEALLVAMPVYRTYVRPGLAPPSERDREIIATAAAKALESDPELDPALLDFLCRLLLAEVEGEAEAELCARFQMLSGPAMAKGLEDTALYCDHRLICLNEVGGELDHFGTKLRDFHDFCQMRAATWPATLNATSTHDTKRGEDVRQRIAVLSQMPDAWESVARRFSQSNAEFYQGTSPDRKTEYLVYQTLVGAWPLSEERLQRFVQKALREAKEQTSWTNVNEEYEERVRAFVSAVIGNPSFIEDLESFLEPVRRHAELASLSQLALKLCVPGVPDVYQGTELWDDSLTDPDNRRPVDFELRARLLAELEGLDLDQVLARSSEGLPKLFLLQRGLTLRRRYARALGPEGSYEPLWASGPHADSVIAFVRGGEVLVVAPRLTALVDGWQDTVLTLPDGNWQSLLGEGAFEGRVEVSDLLRAFPVALLVNHAAR